MNVPITQGADSLPTMLMAFQHEDSVRYVVGLPNFYVITRYNHSQHYAMAVWELAQAIRLRAKAVA